VNASALSETSSKRFFAVLGKAWVRKTTTSLISQWQMKELFLECLFLSLASFEAMLSVGATVRAMGRACVHWCAPFVMADVAWICGGFLNALCVQFLADADLQSAAGIWTSCATSTPCSTSSDFEVSQLCGEGILSGKTWSTGETSNVGETLTVPAGRCGATVASAGANAFDVLNEIFSAKASDAFLVAGNGVANETANGMGISFVATLPGLEKTL